MATQAYESVRHMAELLSPEERLRLIEELQSRTRQTEPAEPQHSIMELCGLGAEIWEGIDAQEYVNQERDSWDG